MRSSSIDEVPRRERQRTDAISARVERGAGRRAIDAIELGSGRGVVVAGAGIECVDPGGILSEGERGITARAGFERGYGAAEARAVVAGDGLGLRVARGGGEPAAASEASEGKGQACEGRGAS